MFVLKTEDGRYYNGRANLAWDQLLTTEIGEAFHYNTYDNAAHRAEGFNSFRKVHGLYFQVVETE